MKSKFNFLNYKQMQSVRTVIAMKRFHSLLKWVRNVMGQQVELIQMKGGNSIKRYYRINNPDTGLIAVDMPPSKREARFLPLRNLFHKAGIRVPEVHSHLFHKNTCSGFYIIEDLGANNTYSNVLKIAPWRSYNLYRNVWELIAKIQAVPTSSIRLPTNFDIRLDRGLRNLPKWYATLHSNRSFTVSEHIDYYKVRSLLKKSYRDQAKVIIHGDLHLGNMFDTFAGPAIIDFANSGIGPPTYDIAKLASSVSDDLLRFDYVKQHWKHSLKIGLPVNKDFDEHYRQYEWIYIQMILVSFSFHPRAHVYSRKQAIMAHEEQKIITIASRYRELQPLVKIFERRIGLK